MARTFREVWRWLGPTWLVGHVDDVTDEGARVTNTITTIIDTTLERARQGLDARFPTRTGESANELTAADRGLLRGRAETLAQFAERMKAWRTPRTHRVRGGAYELLAQLKAYWGSLTAMTVDLRGRTWVLDTAGDISDGGLESWDWDSANVIVTPTSGVASDILGAGVMTPTVPTCQPGALLFAHSYAEAGGIAPPVGWTLVLSYSDGTNYHVVHAKLATNSGGGTEAFTKTGGARGIVQITQVPGTWVTPIADNFETSLSYSGSGTSVTEPAFDDAQWVSNMLAFVGYDSGGTINAFAGGDASWSEVGPEATAGSAAGGCGIQAQYASSAAGDTFGAGAATLSDGAAWNVIGVRFRRAWARFWLTIEESSIDATPDFGDPELWGGAVGTPGYTLGQVGVTPADVLAMRNLMQQYAWHPEHSQPEWLVVNIAGSAGALPVPDGTWAHWSKKPTVGAGAGIQVPARSGSYRYWSLDPLYNNTYAGNPESFCLASRLVDGVTEYAGDPENAAAWGAVTMPNGVDTYTGDPENAAAWNAVLLLDDGANP